VLSKYRTRVLVCEEHGIDLTARFLGDESAFTYVDPPYLGQGDDLYLNTLAWPDHQRLARLLAPTPRGWFLTYDADPRVIEELYAGLPVAEFQTSHTAATQHVGKEYAVFARSMRVASLDGLGSGDTRVVAVAS
jgi:DNA adenine methylase